MELKLNQRNLNRNQKLQLRNFSYNIPKKKLIRKETQNFYDQSMNHYNLSQNYKISTKLWNLQIQLDLVNQDKPNSSSRIRKIQRFLSKLDMQQIQSRNNCMLNVNYITKPNLIDWHFKEANKLWNIFIGEDLIIRYNFRREKIFKIVIEEIKQLQDYYCDSLSEMLSSIDAQLINNNQELQNYLKLENNQIFELDEKQGQKLIDLFSQQDKIKYILQQQEDQDRLDNLFYQNVNLKLETLVRHHLLSKQQLMKILQEQQDSKNIGNIIQADIESSPENISLYQKGNCRINTNKYFLNQLISKQNYRQNPRSLNKKACLNKLLNKKEQMMQINTEIKGNTNNSKKHQEMLKCMADDYLLANLGETCEQFMIQI